MSVVAQAMPINIGIDEKNRKDVADGLCKLLADTYTLYLKTLNYHWNVTGPMFQTLHLMFEEDYIRLFDAVDLIAERIRALGFPAPATYNQFSKLTSVNQDTEVPPAEEMIRQLVRAHETTIQTARNLLPVVESANDQTTLDMVADRLQAHEKSAWMLRSLVS